MLLCFCAIVHISAHPKLCFSLRMPWYHIISITSFSVLCSRDICLLDFSAVAAPGFRRVGVEPSSIISQNSFPCRRRGSPGTTTIHAALADSATVLRFGRIEHLGGGLWLLQRFGTSVGEDFLVRHGRCHCDIGNNGGFCLIIVEVSHM